MRLRYIPSKDEIEEAERFAIAFAERKDRHNFAQKDDTRSFEKVVEDVKNGKLAEIAFCYHSPFEIKPDFDVYEGFETRDFLINGYKLEIKASKNGRCLMLDCDRKSQLILKDVYVFANVFSGIIDLVAFISSKKFLKKSRYYKKGDFIPGTTTPMVAPNLIVQSKNMSGNWSKLFTYLENGWL